MNLNRILTIVIAIIAVVAAVMYISIFRADVDAGETGSIDGMLQFGKILVIITALIALFFALKNIATDPQKLKKSLISLVIFGILAAVAYAMAGSAIPTGLDDEIVINEGTSKMVGAGIYLFYFLSAIAILAMVVFGIKKTIK